MESIIKIFVLTVDWSEAYTNNQSGPLVRVKEFGAKRKERNGTREVAKWFHADDDSARFDATLVADEGGDGATSKQ